MLNSKKGIIFLKVRYSGEIKTRESVEIDRKELSEETAKEAQRLMKPK
jgi:hypothetical protein